MCFLSPITRQCLRDSVCKMSNATSNCPAVLSKIQYCNRSSSYEDHNESRAQHKAEMQIKRTIEANAKYFTSQH